LPISASVHDANSSSKTPLVFDDQHLGRLVARYKECFNEARPHRGIGQRIPGKQPAVIDITKPIVAKPVFGGLHHDYRIAA
jgi:putative transposase